MLKNVTWNGRSSILEITTILSVRKHLMVNIIRKCGDCNENSTTKGGVSKVHGDTSALLCFFQKEESMTFIIASTKLIVKTKAEPDAAASCVLVVMSLRSCCCFAENNDTITAIPIAPDTC